MDQKEIDQEQQHINVNESQDQRLKRFRAAIVMSRIDKLYRKKCKVNQNEKFDIHEMQLKHNGKTSVVFITSDPIIGQFDQLDQALDGDVSVLQLTQSNIIEQNAVSTLIEQEGFILKKSPHFWQGWVQKYIKISNKILKYYLLDNLQIPFGTLNFDLVTYSYNEIKEQGQVIEFILTPQNLTKVFHFKGINQQATLKWAAIIQEHLKASAGHQKILSGLCQYQRFWRTDRIGAKQFGEYANTGDILLFRGNTANCILQRTFTGSEFDHVALVLKYSTGLIYILEATGYSGVGLTDWAEFIDNQWQDCYEKIVLRRLVIKRDREFMQEIQKFVNDNIGKQYSLTPAKLLRMKSTIKEATKPSQQNKEERTYFCSELVAACYKQMNLLPQEISSSQYWPGSFGSSNKNLKLLQGSLSDEYLIDFTSL